MKRHPPAADAQLGTREAGGITRSLHSVVPGEIGRPQNVIEVVGVNRPWLVKPVRSIERTLERVVLCHRPIRVDDEDPIICEADALLYAEPSKDELDCVIQNSDGNWA